MNIKQTLAALLLTTTLTACGSDEAKSVDEVEDLILYAQFETHANLLDDAMSEARKDCHKLSEEKDCVWFAEQKREWREPYYLAGQLLEAWTEGDHPKSVLDISPLEDGDRELRFISEAYETLPPMSFEEMTEFWEVLTAFARLDLGSEKALREYFFARYGGKHPQPEVDKELRKLMKLIEEEKADKAAQES